MVMCEDDPVPPPFIATWSSPTWIKQCVMVTLVAFAGSIPSVLRDVFGASIITPHAVNPSPWLYDT